MNLTDLPIEIGVIIIKYLDTKSKINIYNTCLLLRHFISPSHLRKVTLSRSNLGSLSTLDYNIFADLPDYIQDLDLSGVPDINAGKLIPYIKRMSNLKRLDITYTDIYLSDFPKICPKHLTSLSMNFFKCPRKSRNEEIWDKCRELFKENRFSYIHFVVFEFLDSDIPLMFLYESPTTQDLKVTVADNYRDFFETDDDDVSMNIDDDYCTAFSRLTYVFRDCRVTHKTSRCLRGVSNLDFNQIEYVFVMYLEKIVIFISPIFADTFFIQCNDLKIDVVKQLPLNFMLDGNIIFKAWSKKSHVFDQQFFDDFHKEFQNYFPTYICTHEKLQMKITKAPSSWFCIDGCEGFENNLDNVPENVTLTDFCRKDGSVLRSTRPITLNPSSNKLSNITLIRLSNICLKEDFFTVLFSKCKRLYTLDIYVEKRGRLGIFRGCTLYLSRSIHLTASLRNLKFTSEDIEYELLFDTLSRCKTLENVHVCEYERTLGDENIGVYNIIDMIEKCERLYSLFIEADMPPECLTLLMSPLRDAAQRSNKDYLSIEVCDCYRGWNPFADVFNPSPLHILD